MANQHYRKWRYVLKTKMCAIVVYGESEKENKLNTSNITYMLGNESVKGKSSYEHLGLTTVNSAKHIEGTSEKVNKGWGTLSPASGIGITHERVSIKACNIVFWSMVVPTVIYASEHIYIWKPNTRFIEDCTYLWNFGTHYANNVWYILLFQKMWRQRCG